VQKIRIFEYIRDTLHSGPAEGTIRKKSKFTKTAITYHILPSWGHWSLYQSISGEILTNFLVKTIFVAQNLTELEHFKDCKTYIRAKNNLKINWLQQHIFFMFHDKYFNENNLKIFFFWSFHLIPSDPSIWSIVHCEVWLFDEMKVM